MKISQPFIAFLIALLTANSASAHTSAAHPHSWYAWDHIIIALGIALSAFLLFKIILVFIKKLTTTHNHTTAKLRFGSHSLTEMPRATQRKD